MRLASKHKHLIFVYLTTYAYSSVELSPKIRNYTVIDSSLQASAIPLRAILIEVKPRDITVAGIRERHLTIDSIVQAFSIESS